MSKLRGIRGKGLSKRHIVVLGILGLLISIAMVAAACGGDDTLAPAPATATLAARATPTSEPQIRPIEEWTPEEPATLEELEAELEKHRGESFTWVSWGGAYENAQRAALLTPFEEKFGIVIVEDSPVVYSKFRAMANIEDPEWHIVDLGSQDIRSFIITGDLEPFDMAIVGGTFPDLLPSVQENFPHGAGGGSSWTYVLGYNTDEYPEGTEQPDSWADFFDTEKFPGRRATNSWWPHNPTIGLLADDPSLLETEEGRTFLGGPFTQEEIDRSFDKWRELSEDPEGGVIFTEFGVQCPELLISRDIVMGVCGNGRIYDAVRQDDAPLALDWEAGYIVSTDMFGMPAGLKESNPNAYLLANLWAAWSSFPEINAAVSLGITYGPVNLKGAQVIAEDSAYDAVRDSLPLTADTLDYAIFLNERWAGENSDRLQAEWNAVYQE